MAYTMCHVVLLHAETLFQMVTHRPYLLTWRNPEKACVGVIMNFYG